MLDYKIRELKLQVEPREAEIRAMRRQIKEVRRCTAGGEGGAVVTERAVVCGGE